MTAVHFRPKYDIEQYLVQFSFPAPLDSLPTITVDVESGEASDTESFVGLPIWQGADVFVRVTGGTAGCVYRVTCNSFIGGLPVSRGGLIAVMPTTASMPEGTPPVPVTRSYTTPPYPVIVSESVESSGGVVRGLINSAHIEDLFSGGVPIDGDLRDVKISYETFENFKSSGVAVNGSIRDVKLTYAAYEELFSTGVPLDGDIIRVLVRYSTEPQELHSYGAAINGDLQ